MAFLSAAVRGCDRWAGVTPCGDVRARRLPPPRSVLAEFATRERSKVRVAKYVPGPPQERSPRLFVAVSRDSPQKRAIPAADRGWLGPGSRAAGWPTAR